MHVSTRIFRADDRFERAIRKLVSLGVPEREINVLRPALHDTGARMSETEDALFTLRGVGRVIASGERAKALLESATTKGEGDAGSGKGAGPSAEDVPSLDDFFVFEDALRKHEKVLFVSVPAEHQWKKIEAALDACGGKDIYSAREDWWAEICEREQQAVETGDAPHDVDDYLFRLGFELALSPLRRELSFEEARDELREAHPEACDVESFRRGYTRGRAHQETFDRTTAERV